MRKTLLEERRQVLAGIGQAKLQPLDEPADDGEQAMALHDDYVSISVHGIAVSRLREIDLALDRLESGDYGICVTCEAPITERRLQLIPWAAECVWCRRRASGETGAASSLRGVQSC